MIDDDTLAAHVRAALDGVEVPADGPGQVLAVRDLLSAPVPSAPVPSPDPENPGGSRNPRRPAGPRWLLGSAAALVVLVLIAVAAIATIGGGGGANTTKSKSSSDRHSSSGLTSVQQLAPIRPGSPAAAGSNLVPNSGSISTPSSGPGPALAAPPTTPSAGPTPDRVVQTGSLTLTVAAGHLDATVAALGDRARGAGGQVSKSQTVAAASDPSADLTLKVPAASFTDLVGTVRNLGTATSVNTSAVDVTATYVDLTARLNALEATRAQFLQILAKAQSIGDILAVEAQITPLQTQIEQLQGQQQVLDDQTSFATLDIHVAVPPARAPAVHSAPGGLSGAWDHARHAFAGGIESVVSSLGGIAVFLVCVAVLAGVGRIGWEVIRRRLV
ncbi:MAG: DUF4349 domain-containing protein [Actinomycetota bacterium]|nr:DUF4349 domain-containing protein [Actinomycetota bacterium]